MPNFARLASEGSFRRLTTSNPAAKPVAWSNLITGMNAGGHGIFDFIHRDPKTFQLYFFDLESRRAEAQFSPWQLGDSAGSGSAEQLRHGKAFLEILDEQNVPNYVYRIPANFPPIAAKGKDAFRHGHARSARHIRHVYFLHGRSYGSGRSRRGRRSGAG